MLGFCLVLSFSLNTLFSVFLSLSVCLFFALVFLSVCLPISLLSLSISSAFLPVCLNTGHFSRAISRSISFFLLYVLPLCSCPSPPASTVRRRHVWREHCHINKSKSIVDMWLLEVAPFSTILSDPCTFTNTVWLLISPSHQISNALFLVVAASDLLHLPEQAVEWASIETWATLCRQRKAMVHVGAALFIANTLESGHLSDYVPALVSTYLSWPWHIDIGFCSVGSSFLSSW